MPIKIDINAGHDAGSSSVSFEGDEIELISDEDRKAFNLSDSKMLDAIGVLQGQRPGKLYMRDHPHFAQYGWSETQRVLNVKSTKVLSLEVKPVALISNSYENMRGDKPTTHTATLAYSAALSKASTWKVGTKISVAQKISYKIGVPSNEVGGETSFGLESSFGVGGTETRTSTITTTNAVNLVLDPGQAATAVLSASQGTLRIQVEYDVYLQGRVHYSYDYPVDGHYHWSQDTDDLLTQMGVANHQTVTEILEIGFYSDAKVTVRDTETATDMQVVPAHMTMD